MDISIVIVLIAVFLYVPLASVLLYVWWKHGKGEMGVSLARGVFLVGSVLLFAFLFTV